MKMVLKDAKLPLHSLILYSNLVHFLTCSYERKQSPRVPEKYFYPLTIVPGTFNKVAEFILKRSQNASLTLQIASMSDGHYISHPKTTLL